MIQPFPRPRPETWHTRLWRWGFNFFPAYRGTGGQVTYIAPDWREVHVALPLNWRTRNYVGTLFGGSMYGAIDPIYMLMLIKNLGPGYVVWDKAATIRFRRPGRSTLFARFELSEQELAEIRRLADEKPSIERIYPVELLDASGVVHASFEKTLYIRKDKELR
ncbi:MAG: DUF4442 domain-containing protein [Meiothermus sp.]|uniref:DUF4442 domain-containing protein n=1 Tax=Meiothermus sp. TaxID=1955249 RepID=UPI0025E158EF|nr:DUF4442 domain-containing protein [Meiothermus sp.]MCS7069530.1 DUF4442 domain-containing protein [Meiothermus sp.]MCX7600905.1 DUF4442 domain-containing protein [Meiothermus sp.]MDW8426875.1 DUF4442 domain-containing protein [Meiothermus sp.]